MVGHEENYSFWSRTGLLDEISKKGQKHIHQKKTATNETLGINETFGPRN